MKTATVQASPAFEAEVAAEPSAEVPGSIVVETRFGEIEFQWDKALYMPTGLLGFPEHHAFGLANLPNQQMSQFKLLQCLTDPGISFIVAPLNVESGAIAGEDLAKAGASLAILRGDMTVLLVVTVRKAEQGIAMTVNLQAPIIIDMRRQTAWQFVLPGEKYPVQRPL
ncbi:MAG: flagellar assembly protein FliW [Proteobacteria bacterium]|nr:flagellar assembly protein FliW [Pseudomonadota bacterium]